VTQGPTQERLADVPGDLDVCIAQRAFKDAVQLAVKAKEELDGPIGVRLGVCCHCWLRGRGRCAIPASWPCVKESEHQSTTACAYHTLNVHVPPPALVGAQASIPELKQSIEGRISFLTNTLCLELQRPAMRMQTIRNIVSLLLQLGESEMARRMYLTNRGKAIERALQ